MDKINLAVIGLGCRGSSILRKVLIHQKDVNIIAVCDKYQDRINETIAFLKDNGFAPVGYLDYKEAITAPNVNAALIFTPWDLHTEMAIYAMKHGIPVGSEVGSEYTIDNCYDLVKTYEETKTPYMFMENCCYGKEEMLATSMVRKGLLGTIVHCNGCYGHDLRKEVSEGIQNRHYRYGFYSKYNFENYPTHELGPIARILNINRGNRIISVSSFASKSVGIQEYAQGRLDLDESIRNTNFTQGDVIDTIIKCAGGETIHIKLDTSLPRFYSRNFTVHGTKGLYSQDTNTVIVDGIHNKKEIFSTVTAMKDLFNNAARYENEYLPDIWKEESEDVKRAGHGGMDFHIYRAFLDCVKYNKPMPIDAYDGASWMAVSALSALSIKENGAPQEMPDFTNGAWQTRTPEDIISFK